jgi:hypothetical protein
MHSTHGRWLVGLVLAVCLATAGAEARLCFAQEWARKMFDHLSHDFGVVARGAKAEHVFTIENIYVEDAEIASIRSTCGCSIPEIDRRRLKTWEKAQLKIVLDTKRFYGRRDATIRVTFSKPYPAEVQLQIYCFIRSDVVIKPEVVQFGSVAAGKETTQKATVTYAVGRPDWKIERVESHNEHLSAVAVELQRTRTQVSYELTVTLKSTAPPGYIQEQLILVTNDYAAQSAKIPVPVEGIVMAAITVRPSPLMLGLVEAGQSTPERPLVVQGNQPFTIRAVRCTDQRFKITVPTEAKTVHLVPVSFQAGQAAEKVSAKLIIETDQGTAPVEVPIFVQVVPKSDGSSPPPKQ